MQRGVLSNTAYGDMIWESVGSTRRGGGRRGRFIGCQSITRTVHEITDKHSFSRLILICTLHVVSLAQQSAPGQLQSTTFSTVLKDALLHLRNLK